MIESFLTRTSTIIAINVTMIACLIGPNNVAAHGANEIALKKKVTQYFHGAAASAIRFVDLNGDGTPEAIVEFDDPEDCGSHGCSVSVLDLRGPTAKSIGDFISFSLEPLSSRTRGWRDISVYGVRFRFNGRAYDKSGDSAVDVSGPKLSPNAIVLPAALAADPSDPASVVSDVVKLDGAGEGEPFRSDEFIGRYFTTQFKASWDHAMAQPGDVLDGDPVTGSQALKSVKLQATQTTVTTPGTALVVAKLAVTPRGGKPYPQSVTFTVKRDGSTWKIDDISGPADGSLRGYFKKDYGQ